MESDASDPNNIITTLSTSPPPTLMLAPHSPRSHSNGSQKQQQFSSNFAVLYHSIFPPNSPLSNTTSSTTITPPPHSSGSSGEAPRDASSSSSATTGGTGQLLEKARLVAEYENLRDRYAICRDHLQDLTNEINALRRENVSLKIATLHDCFCRMNLADSGSDFGGDELSSYSPTSVVEQSRFERAEPERVWLPKSISVRSSGYLKGNQSATNNSGSSRTASQLRRVAELDAGKLQQRMYLPGSKKELEVYSQGMFKTELCNKWQETGACPYGDHCQFAHGIPELRPVIRHPRYKTEVCRMVLAGDNCPYGHRCHFRHSLTEQELMLARNGPR